MSSNFASTTSGRGHRPWAAAGLFLLAPLVGEFLLGNLPITWLWALMTLAPLYGGAALLIREVARRASLGWPGILLLGLAFGVVEEAFVTGSLFNPDYAGLRLLDYGYVPELGVGAWWTVFVLSLHTIWSTTIPIALVESLTPGARRSPWLGRLGLGVAAAAFLAGCAATAMFQPAEGGHSPSVAQLASSTAVVVALVVAALTLTRTRVRDRSADPAASAPPPSPALVGGVTLAAGSAFLGLARLPDTLPAVLTVGAMLAMLSAVAVVLLRWAARYGWSPRHEFAAAGGFLLTYAWYGFVQVPSVADTDPIADTVGNAVLAAAAVVLLVVAWSRTRVPVETTPAQPAGDA